MRQKFEMISKIKLVSRTAVKKQYTEIAVKTCWVAKIGLECKGSEVQL